MAAEITVFLPPELVEWFESYRVGRRMSATAAMRELTDEAERIWIERSGENNSADDSLSDTAAYDWGGRLQSISFEGIIVSASIIQEIRGSRGWNIDQVFAWILETCRIELGSGPSCEARSHARGAGRYLVRRKYRSGG